VERIATLVNSRLIRTIFNILQKQVADLRKYSNIIVFTCIEEEEQLTKKVRISAEAVPDSIPQSWSERERERETREV
jgi:hypothetical protein